MQMQGSVLLVFILSSLFAGEESQLGRNEKEISVSCEAGGVKHLFWDEDRQHTFHSMKIIRDRSSKPPMTLPIRIQSEIGMARPFRTSRTVWTREGSVKYESRSISAI